MADRRAFVGSLAAAVLLAPLRALAQAQDSLAVEAAGELPGFRIEDCPPWLAAQMEKAGGAWHFAAGGGAGAPNRVEWLFEIQPYAGGQVRQFFPMAGRKMLGARRLITAQARLYIRAQYQTAALGQEVVSGGDGDPVLAAFITRVTQNLINGYGAIDMAQPVHRAP